MTAVVTAAILLLASTGAWTVVLALGLHSRPATAVVLMAVSLWVVTVASIAGMLISRSQWARRLGLTLTLGHATTAAIASVDPWWWVGAALSMAAAVSVAGPWLKGYVRSLPAAAGPPARAVVIPILLVGTPFLVGLAGGDRIAAALVGGGAFLTAFWFVRTLPAALMVVRVVWPLAALTGGWVMGWPAGTVAAAMGLTVATVAWDSSVTRAVVPLVERGSVVPIPPELTPREILDAADLDDKGHRR